MSGLLDACVVEVKRQDNKEEATQGVASSFYESWYRAGMLV